MSCEQNLFTKLGGTPTPGGTWILKSITNVGASPLPTLPFNLSMAEGTPTPGAFSNVAITTLPSGILDVGSPGSNDNLWWKPVNLDGPTNCNTSFIYTFTYTPPETLCADPMTADVVWTLRKTGDSSTSVNVCDGASIFVMQPLLTGCGAGIPGSGTWTHDAGNPFTTPENLAAGTFDPTDSNVAGGQVYTYYYTIDYDGTGPGQDCAECVDVHTLIITITAGSSAGGSGSVTTCI